MCVCVFRLLLQDDLPDRRSELFVLGVQQPRCLGYVRRKVIVLVRLPWETSTRDMLHADRRQATGSAPTKPRMRPESCANCRPRAADMQRRQAYCIRERACVRKPAHGRVWVGSIQRAPTEAPRCAPACLAASLAGTPGRAFPRAAANPSKAKAQCVRRPEQPTVFGPKWVRECATARHTRTHARVRRAGSRARTAANAAL